ncbi:MAG: prepilin-type N-terminal cleavage/methylation domain-containing protein [Lachnospiraceae bacterium]|nr:prepilin-type N-terminal cleavage/methylation domain-containing protein [Lachnospiraceae bacterium]
MTTAEDRRKVNKDAGFSLVELLIAVVILAIIVIPLMNLFVSSNRINIKSRQTLRATTVAQDIMEGLKAYDIEEIKTQFADPSSGFYVIDSRLIKGSVAEETGLEVDPSGNPAPGLYVFSMRQLSMQGSEYDAKIEVDGRGYMTGTLTHDNEFNDAALADARSIDKENGTFVEAEKYRQAALASVFKDSDIKNDIENRLRAAGVSDVMLTSEFQKIQDAVHYKNLHTFFDQFSRTIEIELSVSAEVDEDGRPKADMVVTQTYDFTYSLLDGTTKVVSTKGDIGSGYVVNAMPCGRITKTKDDKINVNLFYYPLYDATTPDKITDKIIVRNGSGADLNLLIAKQRHEKEDVSNPGMPDLSDPEYLSDPQLMAAEQAYKAAVEIQDGLGAAHDKEKFFLKTNLGLNLVGKNYLAGAPLELPAQFTVNGTNMDLSGGSDMNIFTLDGVRSPMGRAAAPGEATELIYDVTVSVYKEGAADSGFPDDMRMVVIGGSTTN